MTETLEASITFDVLYHANLIENICEGKLLPEPKGIYITTQVEPVMVDGQRYYTLEPTPPKEDSVIYKEGKHLVKKTSFSPGSILVPIVDINTVKTAVYNEDGKVIIRTSLIKNKERNLNNTSFLPYRGIKIVELLIQDHINSTLQHRKHRRNCYDEIAKHILPEVLTETAYDLFSGDFELLFDELRRDIEIFLGSKTWNIYHTTTRGTRVTIERGIDYRVNEWEKQHGATFRNGKYAEFAESDTGDWATDKENTGIV